MLHNAPPGTIGHANFTVRVWDRAADMQPLILLQTDDPMKLIAIALGGFGLVYLVVLRPMMRKKKDPLDKPSPSSRGGLGSGIGLSQQRMMERDMQNLLVEYERMMRNMTASLDTRAAKLEVLIREADEKLSALRTANQRNVSVFAPMSTLPASDEAPAAPPNIFESTPSSPAPAQPTIEPRHAEIYALADQGLSPKAIARQLNQPDGEIELILALRSGME